jgi:hypothetical protein
MLTISFETELKDASLFLTHNRMIINGVLLASSNVSRFRDDKPDTKLQASISNPEEVPLLSDYPVETLAKHFAILNLELRSPLPEFTVQASLRIPLPPIKPRLNFQFVTEIDGWAGPWTLGEYQDTVRHVLSHSDLQDTSLVEMSRSEANELHFRCTLIESPSFTLQDEINYWIGVLSEVIRNAQKQLSAKADRNTLVTLFGFPLEVSTACEQYLLYFVQFLRDLGIKADASIKHEAHQVLFSVTPEDGAEALDRIREALDIYLRLPDSPEFATQAPAYGDIAVQQLQANIFHLKGQLAVAGAVLQAKNAQIEALQLSNFTYQQLLATQQQAATLPLLPPGTSEADVEPLVPGVIEVTKYEGKGFTVNLPELLRRLKRSFNQE